MFSADFTREFEEDVPIGRAYSYFGIRGGESGSTARPLLPEVALWGAPTGRGGGASERDIPVKKKLPVIGMRYQRKRGGSASDRIAATSARWRVENVGSVLLTTPNMLGGDMQTTAIAQAYTTHVRPGGGKSPPPPAL